MPAQDLRAQLEELEDRVYDLRKRLDAAGAPERLPTEPTNTLVCLACGEHLALPLAGIQEVVPAAMLVSVPETAPWVLGLLNLRGRPIPVIDLAARMMRDRRRLEVEDLIVVYETDARRAGIVVQGVIGVQRFEPSDLEPETALSRGPYVLGVARSAAFACLWISVERLLLTSDLPSAPASPALSEPS